MYQSFEIFSAFRFADGNSFTVSVGHQLCSPAVRASSGRDMYLRFVSLSLLALLKESVGRSTDLDGDR